MKEKIGDKQRLAHILDAISEIEAYTGNVELKDFLGNSMMKFASIKQIEIIGEAANYITSETKQLFCRYRMEKDHWYAAHSNSRVFWGGAYASMAGYH